MSKKGDKGQNQPKVFISFGDVAGGFRPLHSNGDESRSTAPVYTGSDSELGAISKKLLKKDNTTKLKAVQDLVGVLKVKPEYIIEEFLTYFVYCFARLALEDSRSVRLHICQAISSVVSVEKRLLAPHMKTLIGPWWMLTGDSAPEVAEAALAAFQSAIPPKKRPSVLAYLAPSIVKEAAKNMQHRAETLSDLSVTTPAEAAERLERVHFSTICSIGKLMTSVTEEENKQLCAVPEGVDDKPSTYGEFVNDRTWKTGLTSEFASVRKATSQLIAVVATHAYDLICKKGDSALVSAEFTRLLLSALHSEAHVLNLAFHLDALLAAMRQKDRFFAHTSASEQIIPLAEFLLRTHPHIAVEYMLPLVGSLPADMVALLEHSVSKAVVVGAATVAQDKEKSLDGLCNLLILLSEYAEKKSAEGTTAADLTASAPATVDPALRIRSARNRRLIAASRKAQALAFQSENIAQGMKADVCIVELATLMLLRRNETVLSQERRSTPEPAGKVEEVVAQLAQSVILTIQSAAAVGEGGTGKATPLTDALMTAVGAEASTKSSSPQLRETARQSVQAIGKSLQQLQRATLKSIHLCGPAWDSLLWQPLGVSVVDLLLATSGTDGASEAEPSAQFVKVALDLICLSDALSGTVCQALQEKAEITSETGSEGVGVAGILSAIHTHIAERLQGQSDNSCVQLALSQVLIQLTRTVERAQLTRHLPAPSARHLLCGGWLAPAIASLNSTPAVANVTAEALREVFRFVAASPVRDGAEQQEHNLQQLLEHCIAADAMEAVCLLSLCCRQLTWSSKASDWAKEKGQRLLEQAVPTKSSLQFLLLLSTNASLSDVAVAWFQNASARVTNGNKATQYYFLTLLYSALAPPNSNQTSLCPQVQDAVRGWPQNGENEATLHTLLMRWFFGRIRSRETTWRSKDRARGEGHVELHALGKVEVVRSWEDVQRLLLPILPEAETAGVCSEIVGVLNASSINVVVAKEEEDVDLDEEDPASSSPPASGLQPRKWARHALGLLELLQTTAAETATRVAQQVVYFQSAYWNAALLAPDERVPSALECVRNSLLVPEFSGGIAGGICQPTLLFWILCVAQGHPSSASAVENGVRDKFQRLSEEERAKWYTTILSLCASPELVAHESAHRRAVRVLSTLLDSELSSTGSSDDRQPIKIASPPLGRDERPALGAPGLYLNWKPAGNQGAGVPGMKLISAIPCKLAAVHREAGADPYFTIAMDRTGDAALAHELQVEWPKLVIGRSMADCGVDQVVVFPPGEAASIPIARVAGDDAEDGDVFAQLTRWLSHTFAALLQEFLDAQRTDTWSSVLAQKLHLHSAVLLPVARAFAGRDSNAREHFEAAVLAHMRGAVLSLTSERANCSRTSAWLLGCGLMETLLATSLGTGNGLWLPAALANFRSNFFQIVEQAPPAEQEQLLVAASSAMSSLLDVAPQWVLCAEVAERVLVLSLDRLQQGDQAPTQALLGLGQAVWMHKAEHRGDKPDVPALSDLATWEAPLFDRALRVLTDGVMSYDGWSLVRLACAAIHACLLNRHRRSCRDLMRAAVEAHLARLERVALVDPSVHQLVPRVTCDAEVLACATLRLTCCKVLDAHDASRPEVTSSGAKSAPTADPVAEGTTAVDASSADTVQAEERRELEEDTQLTKEIVGEVCFAELLRRFTVTETDVSALADASGGADGGDLDEDGGESTPSSPVPKGTADADSERASYAGGSSRKVSKRAALNVMLRRDPLGSVLLWCLLLQRVDAHSVQGWSARVRCVNFLKKSGIAANALFLMVRVAGDLLQFKDVSALLQRVAAVTSLELQDHNVGAVSKSRKHGGGSGGQAQLGSIQQGSLQHLAVYAVFRTVCTLPAMFRSFWSDDCNRHQKTRLSAFVEERARASLIKREIAMISLSAAAGRWNTSEFTVKGSVVSGEVSAVLSRDETTVEIKVKLPPTYPLKNVEVNCTSRIGVSDGRWRRWVLQIIQLMSLQDGSVVDAVLLWKCNIEKELEGVEPCPICYCTLHTKTLCLPTLACSTCNNKFHSPCLTTWFRSSGKSKCVICQQPFYQYS